MLLSACSLASQPEQSPRAVASPRTAPRDGYTLHDERTVGVFTVQRWVSAASPDVSPAGMCDCLTVVYGGDRKLATLGEPEVISALSISEPSGRDLTNDKVPDFVVSDWSGGAHCCYTTTVFSSSEPPRKILEINTGNCGPGEFEDIDGDGTFEFMTCDDSWADEYCSFAESPFPRVVFSYDPSRGQYGVATPRYAGRFERENAGLLDESRKRVGGSAGPDAAADKCAALAPALALMYVGRVDEGLKVLRELYSGADRTLFEQTTVAKVRQSSLWIAP